MILLVVVHYSHFLIQGVKGIAQFQIWRKIKARKHLICDDDDDDGEGDGRDRKAPRD